MTAPQEQPSPDAFTSAPGDVSKAATPEVPPVVEKQRANEAQLAALLGSMTLEEGQAAQQRRQGGA